MRTANESEWGDGEKHFSHSVPSISFQDRSYWWIARFEQAPLFTAARKKLALVGICWRYWACRAKKYGFWSCRVPKLEIHRGVAQRFVVAAADRAAA